MARIHCPVALQVGQDLALPEGAARHVQVLRMQPGMTVCLFNGQGGEYLARIVHMGRSEVRVQVLSHVPVEREAERPIHLLAGLTANERMDWLVEKATELGAASLTPILLSRSVMRLQGERAERRQQHWQAVAVAACEQSGRNRVPLIHPVCGLAQALDSVPTGDARWILSLQTPARSLAEMRADQGPVWVLSGSEGGLDPTEEQRALQAGFEPLSLGPRVLRAETAPLALLAACLL